LIAGVTGGVVPVGGGPGRVRIHGFLLRAITEWVPLRHSSLLARVRDRIGTFGSDRSTAAEATAMPVVDASGNAG
jgi:hypothetical protein